MFEYHPSLKSLFKGDIEIQKKMLAKTLVFAINNLSDSERINKELYKLGDKHIAYGVIPEHYDIVGKVLIDSLKELLKDSFDQNSEIAWKEVYSYLSMTMNAER